MNKKPLTPEEDLTSIGNILIEMGLISKEKLIELVKEFQVSKEELLGEFIVRHTHITEEHIEIALVRQRAMRNGHTTHAAVMDACTVASKVNERIVNTTEELVDLTALITDKI
jgi:hypothetical protein